MTASESKNPAEEPAHRPSGPSGNGEVNEVDTPTVHRAIGGAAMGNCIEWFDFGVFAYLATTLGVVFFPGDYGTLATFATVAVAFLLRPLGGLFFGPLGDRIGRKRVLATTVLLMSGATLAIGLLPSFDTIGVWSPILLLACRMVQGFATGGEYGGAATFIAEYAPDKRRGFYCSFLEFGTLAGFVLGAGLATGLQLGLSESAMEAWGWRIPFLIAAPLGIVGIYLRNRLEDTPAFNALAAKAEQNEPPRTTLKETVTGAWRPIMFCIGLVLVYNVVHYTVLTYMPTYLSEVQGYSTTTGLLISITMMLVMMAGLSSVGALSDRVGRKPLLITSCAGIFVLSTPAFLLIESGNLVLTWLGLLVLGALLLLMLGTMSATLPNLFPTKVRYGAFAIGYNVSTAAFGGTAAFVIDGLIKATGWNTMPAFYMMAAAAVSMVPILKIAETAGKPMQGSAPTVAVPKGEADRTPVAA